MVVYIELIPVESAFFIDSYEDFFINKIFSWILDIFIYNVNI
jgi:hypothetical protein